MNQLTLQECAEAMLDMTRKTKAQMCEAEGGPHDLMPTLHIVNDDGQSFVALVPDRDYIATVVEGVAPAPMPLTYIGFCADAYGREYQAAEQAPEIERGELSRDFEGGDFTVHEQLIVTVVDVKTGDITAALQRYTYDDTGLPVFEEVLTAPVEFAGQAIDNLRAVAAARR